MMAWIKSRIHRGKRGYLFMWRENGKDRSKTMPVSSKREAERLFPSWVKQLDQAYQAPETTVEQAVRWVLADGSRTLQHRKNLEGIYRKAAVHFGARKLLANITTADVLKWIDTLKENPLSSTTLRHHLHSLSVLFEQAKSKGVELENPCRAVKVSKVIPDNSTKRDRVVSTEEFQRILGVCTGHVRLFVLLAWFTGGRMSEVLQLRWEDVAESAVTFRNNRTVGQRTKSGKDRMVPVSKHVLDYVREHGSKESSWVFANGTARLKSIKKGLAGACSRAGVEGVTAHTLRHSFGSHLLTGGTPVHVVRDLLGHSDFRVTSRYTHGESKTAVAAAEMLSQKTGLERNAVPITVPTSKIEVSSNAFGEVVRLLESIVSVVERETGLEPATPSLGSLGAVNQVRVEVSDLHGNQREIAVVSEGVFSETTQVA